MPASVIFSIRPESDLKAWRALGAAKAGVVSSAAYASSADTGLIGPGIVDMSSSSKAQGVYWDAERNFPSSNVLSVLWRGAIIGSNSVANALWALNFCQQLGTIGSSFQDNTLYTDVESLTAITDIYATGGVWTPTQGVYYDIVWLFSLTANGTNNVQVYVDGVLLYEGDSTGNWGTIPRNNVGYTIGLGTGPYVGATRTKVNEFVIWDGLIDPTNVPLASGNGSLNGAARTAFVDSTQFDGSSYSDPDPSNVLNGVNYTFAGATKTGNLVLPTVDKVKLNTPYGQNGSQYLGTYDFTGEWSDPGLANVLQGVVYLANGATLTGTLQAARTGTMRDFFNAILALVGSTSLTDVEYTSINQSGITIMVYNLALYTQLGAILTGRESVSTVTDRLRFFFQAKGINVDPIVKAKSNILLGIDL